MAVLVQGLIGNDLLVERGHFPGVSSRFLVTRIIYLTIYHGDPLFAWSDDLCDWDGAPNNPYRSMCFDCVFLYLRAHILLLSVPSNNIMRRTGNAQNDGILT